jgi:hypothetical protein
MADGVELLTDMWHPRGHDAAPVLLVRCPYGRRGLFGLQYGRLYAHQGFRVVLQSCRGTHGSGGEFVPFVNEPADGQATVDWLRRQPWFTGSFATVGSSYLGFVQLALGLDPPPELVAVVLQCTPSRATSALYPDGVLAPLTTLLWAAMTGGKKGATARTMLLAATGRTHPLRRATPAAYANHPQLTVDRAAFVEDWLAHPSTADPWWGSSDPSAALDRLNVPVLVQGGWYDPFSADSVEQYNRISRRRLDAHLTMGSFTHASFGRAHATVGTEAVHWLRAGFAGKKPAKPAVRVQLLGTDRWATFQEWPPSGCVDTALYLAPGGALTTAPGTAAAPDTFVFDPILPTPSVGGPLLQGGAGARDNRRLEARPDVLTYTSDPLPQDLDVLGAPRFSLRFGSDRATTDLFVRLCDVHPSGRSTNVVDRLLRLEPHQGRDDGTWDVQLTLPSVAARFTAGHRIRLQVSSAAFPRFAPNAGHDRIGAPAVPAHQQVLFDPDNLPRLVLSGRTSVRTGGFSG